MKIVEYIGSTASYYIPLIPRVFPNESDLIITKLKNENNGEYFDLESSFSYFNNYFNLILTDNNYFKINNKYEFNIYLNDRVIYIGKIYVVNQGRDIQDYTNVINTDKKIQINL